MDKLLATQHIDGTKGENGDGAGLSPIRSGFERNVNVTRLNQTRFLNAQFKKINNFIILRSS
ncbi:hypothetical protein [Mesorhizobium comanense]|uniref:hypothetical protein n=1 Tax=Mesorhizobium comanense TaxID=2502215 RepID=UPI0010F789F6|nr:hypothetical protein [Mesorhizobium comanense]